MRRRGEHQLHKQLPSNCKVTDSIVDVLTTRPQMRAGRRQITAGRLAWKKAMTANANVADRVPEADCLRTLSGTTSV